MSNKTKFLDGRDLSDILPDLIEKCSDIDVCVAFVKIDGLRKILPSLEKLVGKGGVIRFVFEMSGITDKESAEALLKFSKNNPTSQILFQNRHSLHAKAYLLKGDNPKVILGSSNLTGAALSDNQEANVFIDKPDDQLLDGISDFIESCLDDAEPIDPAAVNAYVPQVREPIGSTRHSNHEQPTVSNLTLSFKGTISELLEILGKNRFYIMHLNYSHRKNEEELWNFASAKRLIGLQHRKVDSDWMKIRTKNIKGLTKDWRTQFNYLCEGINANSMENGDIVLVLCGMDSLVGVAEIIGDHKFRPYLADVFFDHVRRVRWIKAYTYEDKLNIPDVEGFSRTLTIVKKGSNRWSKLGEINLV